VVELLQGTNGVINCSGATNVNGCPYRFAYSFSSMFDICTAHPCNGSNIPGTQFEAANIMEQESQGHAPYCFVFVSDMMGTLGPQGAVGPGKTCSINGVGGAQCRYDAFMVCPK
jgi:hypothetical protein